jgi:hypothetical protein
VSQAEAKGRLRRFRAHVVGSADRTRAQLKRESLVSDVLSLSLRGTEKGRQRAARRVRSALPGVFDWRNLPAGLLGALLLDASDPIIKEPRDAGQTQPSVIVTYVVLGTRRTMTSTGLWTLEVPIHALLRAIERDPGGDVGVKVRDAHRALLGAGSAPPPPIGPEFLIPTSGPGAFLVEWVPAVCRPGGALIYARARTWLHDDQLYEEQSQRALRPAAPGEATMLASGLLLPLVLREDAAPAQGPAAPADRVGDDAR